MLPVCGVRDSQDHSTVLHCAEESGQCLTDWSPLAAGEAIALASRTLGEIALGRGVFLHHDEEFALREITRGS